MNFFHTVFPVSGVETWVFLPPAVAFMVSFFTSMGGISGAFILMPFQMSVLNYTAPSVSATNQLFNIVAIPSGVWRYIKERRMVWPLTWAVVIGTLPGVFAGAFIRIVYLPEPANFKFFTGLVLSYIGFRLLADLMDRRGKKKNQAESENKGLSPQCDEFIVTDTTFSIKRVAFRFGGEQFSFSVPGVFLLCFIVGIIGGIYGIGGGSIIAPFFVTFFHLPVYTVAGAALMGTFVTSVAGVIFFQAMAPFYPGMNIAPDWALGILFGIGGLFGMYLGAKCQRYVPADKIKLILCISVLFISGRYVLGYFF